MSRDSIDKLESQIETLKSKLATTLEALETIAEDCRLALSGEWDRSTEGFEASLSVIETAIKEAGDKERPNGITTDG
jgi:hypothetical protein